MLSVWPRLDTDFRRAATDEKASFGGAHGDFTSKTPDEITGTQNCTTCSAGKHSFCT